MTPEGLNARLTFLNQCLRPGDTIPTIDTDGKPVYNDAINTAFGTPPVLVLRIGDFYNTKIIPRNLQISYEPLLLDLNPEGIGVQPMLANVTLSFDFIGGHGLAKPVEELQNALSFNYYANTEIYDERATATEDVSNLDQIVLQGVPKDKEVEPPVVQNKQQNAGGSTIGVILNSNVAESGETGTISYRGIMKSLVDEAQNYFGTVVGKCDSIATAYNYGILQIITSNREYTDGDVGTFQSEIFGKVKELEKGINKLFDGVISDISKNDNVIISGFTSKGYEPDGPVIKTIRENMITYIKGINADFVSGLNVELQSLLEQQQKLINIIDKLNFVTKDYDGKINSDGSALVYNVILASVGDFISDVEIVGNDLKEFMETLGGKGIITPNGTEVDYPTKEIQDKVEQDFFKVVSQTFLDKNKLEEFRTFLLPNGNTIGGVTYNNQPDPLKLLNRILGLRVIDAFDFNIGADSLHEKYTKEQRLQNRHINQYRNTNTKYIGLSRFYKPFNLLTNERKFDYSSTPTPPQNVKDDLIFLFSTANSTTPFFNGKKQLN
jgi:hypothetical protein